MDGVKLNSEKNRVGLDGNNQLNEGQNKPGPVNNGRDSIDPDNIGVGNSIIAGLHSSITNLSTWASYIVKSFIGMFYSFAPAQTHKEDFLAFLGNDQKTPAEKMAELNKIICLGANNPELQQDVVVLIEKFAEKQPAEFASFCRCLNVADLPTLLANITTDATAAFTSMKKAMLSFYLVPYKGDLDNIKAPKRHVINKNNDLDKLLKKLKKTLIILDKQPIVKEVVQAILSESIPHIAGLGTFMIQADQSLPENERFGLFAIAEANKTETPENRLMMWVKDNSFNLKTFTKHLREYRIAQFSQYFSSAQTKENQLYTLDVGLSMVPSNRMVDLILAFTKDGQNGEGFNDLVEAMISIDDPAKPTLPADVRTAEEVKNWLTKVEKFGTELKDGIKVKVDEYAPKVELLRKALLECKRRSDKAAAQKLIDDRIMNFINNPSQTKEQKISELNWASRELLVSNHQLSSMLIEVADNNQDLFTEIAESVIDKQIASATPAFAQIATDLQKKVADNENSAAGSAKVRKKNFSFGLNLIADPITKLHQAAGNDKKMDAQARQIEFRTYINSLTFNREFVASGLSIFSNK